MLEACSAWRSTCMSTDYCYVPPLPVLLGDLQGQAGPVYTHCVASVMQGYHGGREKPAANATVRNITHKCNQRCTVITLRTTVMKSSWLSLQHAPSMHSGNDTGTAFPGGNVLERRLFGAETWVLASMRHQEQLHAQVYVRLISCYQLPVTEWCLQITYLPITYIQHIILISAATNYPSTMWLKHIMPLPATKGTRAFARFLLVHKKRWLKTALCYKNPMRCAGLYLLRKQTGLNINKGLWSRLCMYYKGCVQGIVFLFLF